MDFLKFSKLDLKVLVVGLLLVNIPYWMAFQFNFGSQPLFFFETSILLVLIQRTPLVGFIFFTLITVVAVLVLTSKIYYFSDPIVFLESFKYNSNINALEFITYEFLLILCIFVLSGFWLFKYLQSQKNIKLNIVFYSFIIFFIADVLNDSNAYSFGSMRLINFNIAGSPLYTLFHSAKVSKVPLVFKPKGELSDLVLMAEQNNKNILVIIVESFGEASDPKVRLLLENKLLASNRKLSDIYSIKSGRIPFYGSTTTAELNTLCMVTGDYNNLNDANTSACIPKNLPTEWRTIGIHGFSGDMFARLSWWPLIGLRESFFGKDVMVGNERKCGGAFRGACDEDVLSLAKYKLDGGLNRFVYVLTLNTHLPNQSIEIPESVYKVCNQAKLNQDGCNFLATMSITLEAVNNTLYSVNNKPYIYLVGDHAPPFVNSKSRDEFSQKEVPFYSFIPR
jgi:hypothetical protein